MNKELEKVLLLNNINDLAELTSALNPEKSAEANKFYFKISLNKEVIVPFLNSSINSLSDFYSYFSYFKTYSLLMLASKSVQELDNKIPKYLFREKVGLLSLFKRLSENKKKLLSSLIQKTEKLVRKKSEYVDVIQSRKKEFLKWRYMNHPTRKYEIYILKTNEQLKGYIIFKTHKINQKKIGVILDFVMDDESQIELSLNLVDKALEFFWENDVSVAIATCRSGLIENTVLHKVGFFNIPSFLKPEPLHFIVQLFDSDDKLKKLKKYENWFFSFGDYDVF